MKSIQAFSLFVSIIFSSFPNAIAGPISPKNTDEEKITEMVAFGAIVEMAKSIETRDIDNLASKLHFSYRPLGCHPTNEFSDFCQYQVDSKDSGFGKILIFALGHDKISGKSGGRVIWTVPKDGKCLSKATVLPLLGPGQPKVGNIAEPFAGYTAPPVETEDYLYQSIPGGTATARAGISYRNGCVNQMFLDF